MLLAAPLTACLALALLSSTVEGHGYLRDPPARSSLWRDSVGAAHHAPTNYNDNALNCGGYYAQWGMNKGKCGPCGDPWQDSTPRDNEEGGKYGKGIISRNYTEGQTVRMKVMITANHLGYFEFRLCPLAAPHTPVTHDCLNKHVLLLADGSGSQYKVGSQVGIVPVDLLLPPGVTCQQCVVQWKYHSGNSFGTDAATGQGCIGCGPQEEFYGCADVAIGTRAGGVPPQTPAPQTQPPVTYPPVTYPPVTYPPVTYPPVTYPPVTYPPVTNPPATYRPVTQGPNGVTGFVPINPPTQRPYPPGTPRPTYQPFTYPPVTYPPVTNKPVTYPPVTYPPVTQKPYQPVITQSPTHRPRPPLVTSGPVQTQAPVTYPPVTYPPVTYPPVTYPPVTNAPVTYQPVTYPPVTNKPVTYQPVTYGPTAQPSGQIHVCFSIPPYTTPQLDNWCQVQCHTLGGTCPPDICLCQFTPSVTQKPYQPVTYPPVTQKPYQPVTYPPVTYPPVTQKPYQPVTYPPVTQSPTHRPRPPLVTSGPALTNQPQTQPPVTYPPVTYPPVTYPPITYPPVTYPPVTYPPVTNKPVTYPPVTYRPTAQPTAQPTSRPYTHRPRPPLVGSTNAPFNPATAAPFRPTIAPFTFPPLVTLTNTPVVTYPPYTLPPVTAQPYTPQATTKQPTVLPIGVNTARPQNTPQYYCYSKPPLQSTNLDTWCEKSCHNPGSPCPPDVCVCRQGAAPLPGQATPRPTARLLPALTTTTPSPPATTTRPGPVCFAVAPYTGSAKLDQWCDVQCKTLGGTCPPEYCTCRF